MGLTKTTNFLPPNLLIMARGEGNSAPDLLGRVRRLVYY